MYSTNAKQKHKESLDDEDDAHNTRLPCQWSETDRYPTLQLTCDNLRVTCHGPGRSNKDTGSVRADCMVPASCPIYYFEVKIVNKGRDGFIGVGLSRSDVSLNRMPGWDPNSYGYHGDDGNSFCCSGIGQEYGPKFTTGDVVGCCLNRIDGTCFFTKNGHYLGIAFRNLPVNPTYFY